MYSFDYQKRIRYSEVDRMGYLYYGNYAKLYEIGRVEWLRSLGLTYRDMEDHHHILMPVVSMGSRYLRPVFYDEKINIRTILKDWPTYSITFHVELYNEVPKLVNTGSVTLCFVQQSTRKVTVFPDFLAEKLAPYFPERK